VVESSRGDLIAEGWTFKQGCMQQCHSKAEHAFLLQFLRGLIFTIEIHDLLGRVIVLAVVDGAVIDIEQVRVDKFEYPFGNDEDEVGGDVDVGTFGSVGVEATL
jgi:hypothetical protein